MRILSGTTHNDIFIAPRTDAFDTIVRRRWRTLHRLWAPLYAVSVPTADCELIYSWNHIPLGPKPFIVSIEGDVPQVLAGRGGALARSLLRPMLLSRRCRGLFPVSAYLQRLFSRHNEGWARLDEALAKCCVVHPNLPLRRTTPRRLNCDLLTLTFAGNEWGRKGGAVCTRLARLFRAERVPFRFNIVSGMIVDIQVYTDTVRAFYDSDFREMETGEFRVFRNIPNEEVLGLFQESDFVLLPTLDDTFGYSMLEAMSCGVPAVATRLCSIPEVIDDGTNGILLDIPVDAIGRWRHVYATTPQRDTDGYRDVLNTTFDDLARQCFARIMEIREGRRDYEAMSQAAIDTICNRFEANARAREWHQIYRECLGLPPA